MDLPWSLGHIFPKILGGAKFHDDHHVKFNGNYASVFVTFDRFGGTLVTTS